jgi:hypothetical protein
LPDDGVGLVMMRNTDDEPGNGAFVRKLYDTVFSTFLPDAPVGNAVPPAKVDGDPPATSPSLPPGTPTVDVVMKRALEALGGEMNLRRHRSSESQEEVARDVDGVTEEVRVLRAAPASFRSERTLVDGGRPLGTQTAWFDGDAMFLDSGGPLDRPYRMPPGLLGPTKEENAFFGDADYRTTWRGVELRGLTDLEGERAFVVVKTAPDGATVTDCVSTKTFLVLRREDDDGSVTFSDWRWVDGVRIPFRRDAHGEAGATITRVRQVRFDVPADAGAFHPPVQ